VSTAGQHELRAWKIADDVASAWWTSGAPDSSAAIPLGVLAALSLVATTGDQPGPDLAERICALDQDRFASFLTRVWGLFAIIRPELAIRTGPFATWLDSHDAWSQRNGAWVTARSVLATGEFFTGDERALFMNTDLLGCAYMALANPRGTKARGEVYTPPDVAELLMRIRLAGARPGQTILDDGAGTGSLIRAVPPRQRHRPANDALVRDRC
jgi:hypothetical protein